MKIIKTADPKQWTRQVACSNCRSELEIDLSDLKYTSDQRDGDYVSYTCPVCKRLESATLDLVPQELRYAIPRN